MSEIIKKIESELYNSLEFTDFSVGTDDNGNTVIKNVVECFWDECEGDTSLFMERVQRPLNQAHMIGFSVFNLNQVTLGDAADKAFEKIVSRNNFGARWKEFRCFISSDPEKIKKCKAETHGVFTVLLSAEPKHEHKSEGFFVVPYAFNQNERILQNTAGVFSTWLLCVIQGVNFFPGDGLGAFLLGKRFNKREESWLNGVAEHISKIVYSDNRNRESFLKSIRSAAGDHIPPLSKMLFSAKGYERFVESMDIERPENLFLKLLSYIFKCLCSYSTAYSNRRVFEELLGSGIYDIASYVEEESKYFEEYWGKLWREGSGITKSLPLCVDASKQTGFLNDMICDLENELQRKKNKMEGELNTKYLNIKKRALINVLNENFEGIYRTIVDVKKASREIAWLSFVRKKMCEYVEGYSLENKLDELNFVLQRLGRRIDVNESIPYDSEKLLPSLNAVRDFETAEEINKAARNLDGGCQGRGVLLTSINNQNLNPENPENLIANAVFENPVTGGNGWTFIEGLSDFDVCFLNLN